jgi:hypothetical protein
VWQVKKISLILKDLGGKKNEDVIYNSKSKGNYQLGMLVQSGNTSRTGQCKGRLSCLQ